MKKSILPFLLSLVFLFSSCLKEDHTIRLTNNYSQQINNVTIGTAALGNVASGATSAYKSINTGKFSISGTTTGGQSLTGSGEISGKGKHKWTATVSSGGTLSIKEDK